MGPHLLLFVVLFFFGVFFLGGGGEGYSDRYAFPNILPLEDLTTEYVHLHVSILLYTGLMAGMKINEVLCKHVNCFVKK